MKNSGAWLTLAAVGLLNVIIPTVFLVLMMHGSGGTNEHLSVVMLLIGMHVGASVLYLVVAAFRPSVLWKWMIALGFVIVGVPLWGLYLYVALYPQGMAAVVFFWGPLLEYAAASLLLAVGAVIQIVRGRPQKGGME